MTFDFELEYTFADDRQADLDRQLSLLLTTPVQTMPLDREFGLDMSFVDLPSEASKAAYVAELTEKIPLFFPSLRLQQVNWQADAEGHVLAKVVVKDV